MNLANRRMTVEQGARFGVDQRIDFKMWCVGFEHRKHGRSQKYIAVMLQLGHEHALHSRKIDGIGGACVEKHKDISEWFKALQRRDPPAASVRLVAG